MLIHNIKMKVISAFLRLVFLSKFASYVTYSLQNFETYLILVIPPSTQDQNYIHF